MPTTAGGKLRVPKGVLPDGPVFTACLSVSLVTAPGHMRAVLHRLDPAAGAVGALAAVRELGRAGAR